VVGVTTSKVIPLIGLLVYRIFARKPLPEFEVYDTWSRQRTLPKRNATTSPFKVKQYYESTHKK
jgi:hypothetical protein